MNIPQHSCKEVMHTSILQLPRRTSRRCSTCADLLSQHSNLHRKEQRIQLFLKLGTPLLAPLVQGSCPLMRFSLQVFNPLLDNFYIDL